MQTPWTADDAQWAEILGEHLPLLPGEQVEHYIIAVSAGSGEIDGQMRRVLISTCCSGTATPTHLMNHVMEMLSTRSLCR